MDAFFSRNAILVLFGSFMLLGMGLVGLFGPDDGLTPGLQRLMSGAAPLWLTVAGALGIAAVFAVYAKGALPNEEQDEKNDANEDERDASSEPESDEEETADEPDGGGMLADATLALIEVEVLLGRGEDMESPALGPAVPPSALCRALVESKPAWISSMLRKRMHSNLTGARARFEDAKSAIAPTIPVRGRDDGQAASYRLAALVHLPPSSSLENATETLTLLGKLPGDRFVEVFMARVPEEADKFASSTTVAGPLASENLLEDSADTSKQSPASKE